MINAKALERLGDRTQTEDARRIDEALARLGKPREEPPKICPQMAYLLFGLDLTASRENTLEDARVSISAMFRALAEINAGVALKMAYFRGRDECRMSLWQKDAEVLSRAMEKLSCKTGVTQIGKILQLATDEKEQLSALIYVGDVCEESEGELIGLANTLGKRGIPIFVFHDLAGVDRNAVKRAEPVFRQLADISHGAYCTFGEGSAAELREMLSSVAAFSAAGAAGVAEIAPATTPQAKHLRRRLLLLAPSATNHGPEHKDGRTEF